MTKKDFTDKLNKVFDKLPAWVFTFNSNKPLPQALAGMADHIVQCRGKECYIEVKLDRDKPSPEQSQFQEHMRDMEMFSKGRIFYRQVKTLEELDNVIGEIIWQTSKNRA